MSAVLTIAARELRSMFLSPLAWAILAVVQLILAWGFFGDLDTFASLTAQPTQMDSDLGITYFVVGSLFGTTATILMLVAPIMTMRLVSEEIRSQTLPLLFSAPISMTEIVFGKFLAIVSFFFLVLLITSLMPLSLYAGTTLDLKMLLSQFLGVLLLLSAVGAAGLFLSTLTNQPAVAAVSTFGVLVLLWLLDRSATTGGGNIDNILSYLSIARHLLPMLEGSFSSTDVAYYALFVTTFLVLTIRRLDSYRLQH